MAPVHTFTVWKTDTCPFCSQARGFLDALQKVRPDVTVHLRDANQDPRGFRSVAAMVGRATVPQVFMDDKYIGGWDDLARAARNGQLDAFLDGREWTPPAKGGLFSRFRRS